MLYRALKWRWLSVSRQSYCLHGDRCRCWRELGWWHIGRELWFIAIW